MFVVLAPRLQLFPCSPRGPAILHNPLLGWTPPRTRPFPQLPQQGTVDTSPTPARSSPTAADPRSPSPRPPPWLPTRYPVLSLTSIAGKCGLPCVGESGGLPAATPSPRPLNRDPSFGTLLLALRTCSGEKSGQSRFQKNPLLSGTGLHNGAVGTVTAQSFVPASAVTMKEDECHLGWRTPPWPGQMASVSWPQRDQDSPPLPHAPGSCLSKRVSVACGAQLGGDNPTFPTEALRLQTQPLCSHLVSQRCPP